MDAKKQITVAVIGAGLAGVTAVKCALDEGLRPTCFEQDDKIGGVFYYTEHPRENHGAGAYDGMLCNDGKEAMAFSDYPVPEHYPMNMPWQEYQQYLIDYANHFGVTKHIRFNTTVVKVTPAADYSSTGRWEVHIKDKGSSKLDVQIFDKIMVATGPFRKGLMPNIPGMESFKGQIMHVKDFRKKAMFKGKRVIIIGEGFFGSDMASIAGEFARQTYFVVKSEGGLCIFPRRSVNGKLAFSMQIPRFLMLGGKLDDISKAFEGIARQYINPNNYDIQPKLPILQGGRVGIADNMPELMESGKVIPKRGLKRFTKTGAVFEDGSEVSDIDLVILATGFDVDLGIIDLPGIKGARKQDLNLFLWEFPTNVPHDSLAFISMGSWLSPHGPIAELHSRLAARVFSGKHHLPPKDERVKWVEKQAQNLKDNTAGKFMVLPVRGNDEIAEELGVRPSFWRLFWKNPVMAHKIHYGPNLPVVYRLVGPGAKESAWKEYDNCYRRGYADSTPPTLPTGIHHYAMASVAAGSLAAMLGWMLIKNTDLLTKPF